MHMPGWLDAKTAVSITTFLISFSFTIYVFFSNRRVGKKDLGWSVAVTNIKGFDNDFGGKLKMIFDGVEVKEVSLVKLLIRSFGRKTIEAKDYQGPLSVSVECDRVLWTGDVGSNRNAIRTKLLPDETENHFHIEPIMLNSGDELSFSLLASGYKKLEVSGRISEVKEIRQVKIVETGEVSKTFLSEMLTRINDLGAMNLLLRIAIFAGFLMLVYSELFQHVATRAFTKILY
jgi:hypothetical protein